MKVKYVLDRSESSWKKREVLEKVNRELGDKASISGDTIEVDSFDERKISEILNRVDVKYSRSR